MNIIIMNTIDIYLKPTDQELTIIKNNEVQIETEYINYKDIVCLKPWGYEFLVYESNKLGIWFLNIQKDQGTSLHTHFKKDTIIFVLSGTAKITLINNEILSLGPMKSLYIPKNKFHALSSFSDEVYLMEIEIFDKDTTFSNKNDLLRIDDKYSRKRTGYQSSVSLTNQLKEYGYFYLYDNLQQNVENTTLSVIRYDNNSPIQLKKGYNILLNGEIFVCGKYIKEGSILDNLTSYYDSNDCTILNISNDYANEDSKIIYSIEHLDIIVSNLKRQNKSITLTSGCYDILHVGHIHNLREASKLNDILIVCLSCDSQIKKLKGDNRPINNYNDRINLFKIIPYVDYIVLYDEEDIEKETTLGKIMKCVNANCWVKGSDYTVDKVMEKHPYLNNVILIENIKDKSTTHIIKNITNKY